MDKNIASIDVVKGKYVPHHVMEPGPLSDKKLTGTWKDYVSVTKVGIILSNLITVITGMWLASIYSGIELTLGVILLTILGTSLIIASGTCLNNYIDRDIDPLMKRTKKRALAEGRLDPRNVLIMGFVLAVLGTLLLLYVNLLTTLVALFGLFMYVIVYTMWLKRKHSINTVVGSFSGAVPPVIGWVAVTSSIDAGAWLLFGIMFLWQPPHFFALAMRRCEDYRAAGIPMLPVVKGFAETKKQMLYFVIALIPVSFALYFVIPALGYSYLVLAAILGFTWLGLSIQGFRAKDEILWARKYFVFSLIYLTFLFIGMIIVTLF
ncbi:heme o synthase [Caldalkalibacillus mannanilyticus]|uniref:heme o synthase n=1 Tax=Caldalkalibacillus mannanilyticus TaxID=1418 RepID=UPI00046AF16C|nr:heme o synthase [Caldalkalibacillus mannanilyticus]